MPLLYQVFWLSSTSFKIKLYISITFVFFQRLLKTVLLDCRTQTFSPNWFEVPSMQMMRFLLPFSWLHIEGSDRGEGSSEATLLVAASATDIKQISLFFALYKRCAHISVPQQVWSVLSLSSRDEKEGWRSRGTKRRLRLCYNIPRCLY